MKDKIIKYGTMGSYLLLYVIVAIVSLVSSIHFFNLAHQGWMSTVLACSFEIGQMACLFGALTRKKKGFDIVWIMFVALTLFQCMANTYAAYIGLSDYTSWSELFGLNEMEPIEQKRIIAGISGAILPLIALGFVKCLTDFLNEKDNANVIESNVVSSDETTNDPIDDINEQQNDSVEESEVLEDEEIDDEEGEDEEIDDEDREEGEDEENIVENTIKEPKEFNGIVLSDDEIKKMEEYGRIGSSKEKTNMQEALTELKGYTNGENI